MKRPAFKVRVTRPCLFHSFELPFFGYQEIQGRVDRSTLIKRTGFVGWKAGDILYRLEKRGKIRVEGRVEPMILLELNCLIKNGNKSALSRTEINGEPETAIPGNIIRGGSRPLSLLRS